MNSSEQASSRLIDILLPVAPAADEGNNLMIILACSILAILAIISFYQYYTRGSHRRRLAHIKMEFVQDNISSRELAYQVADTLRDGLALNALSPQARLPASLRHRQGEWHTFTVKLSMYRYAKQQPDKTHLTTLVDESCHWLRCWH